MLSVNLHEFGDFQDSELPQPKIDFNKEPYLRHYYAKKLHDMRSTQNETTDEEIPPFLLQVESVPIPDTKPTTPVDSCRVVYEEEEEAGATGSLGEGENVHSVNSGEMNETNVEQESSPNNGDDFGRSSMNEVDKAQNIEEKNVTSSGQASPYDNNSNRDSGRDSGNNSNSNTNNNNNNNSNSDNNNVVVQEEEPVYLVPTVNSVQMATPQVLKVQTEGHPAIVQHRGNSVLIDTTDVSRIHRTFDGNNKLAMLEQRFTELQESSKHIKHKFPAYNDLALDHVPSLNAENHGYKEFPQHINNILYLTATDEVVNYDTLLILRKYVLELHTKYLSLANYTEDIKMEYNTNIVTTKKYAAELSLRREQEEKQQQTLHHTQEHAKGIQGQQQQVVQEKAKQNTNYNTLADNYTACKAELAETQRKQAQEKEKHTNTHSKQGKQTSIAGDINSAQTQEREQHYQLRASYSELQDRLDDTERQCASKAGQCDALKARLAQVQEDLTLCQSQQDTQIYQMSSISTEAVQYRRTIDDQTAQQSIEQDTSRNDRSKHQSILTALLSSGMVQRHKLHKGVVQVLKMIMDMHALTSTEQSYSLPQDDSISVMTNVQRRELLGKAEKVKNPRFSIEVLQSGVEGQQTPISELIDRLHELTALNKAFFARNTSQNVELQQHKDQQKDQHGNKNDQRLRSVWTQPQIRKNQPVVATTDPIAMLHGASKTSVQFGQ